MISACKRVLLRNVVLRLLPFHRTVEPAKPAEGGTKFDPITVRAKGGPPAPASEGKSEVTTGTGALPATVTLCGVELLGRLL
jgi:hypothetical protein